MAVTPKIYGTAMAALAAAGISWTTDTIKAMLCTSAYTPDQDAHQYKSSVTNEVTGTGYTAGGATLASKTSTYVAASNTLQLDAADVVWSSSTITARYVVLYKDTGTSATSQLIAYFDLGADVSSTAGAFTITWDATGVLTFTTA